MPAHGAGDLARALVEDSRELFAAAGLPLAAEVLEPIALSSTLKAGEAAVITFTDVPALPLPVLESLPDVLREADVALGPCGGGSIYLLALAAGVDGALVAELCRVLSSGAENMLSTLTEVLTDAQAEVELLPVWLRLSTARDFDVVDNMARLSVLREDGEEDFAAERLRQWLETHAANQF